MAEPVEGDEYQVTWGGTVVPGVNNFSRTKNTGERETTDFDSGKDKEYKPTKHDRTFSLEIFLEPGDADQEAALSDWEDDVIDTLAFEPKSASSGDRTWSASAFATSVSDSYELETNVAVTVEFRVTGTPTITVEP